MAESAKKEAKKNPKGNKPTTNNSGTTIPEVTIPDVNPTGNTLSGANGVSGKGGTGSGSDGGGKIRNITINIEKLVERLEIHSATISESTEQIQAVITQTFLNALTDTQSLIA